MTCVSGIVVCCLRSLYGGYHSLQTPDTTDLSRLTHTILNVIASKIDIHWLVNWVRSFAKTLGDVVPVRVRTQKTVDGAVRKRYSGENYTLLLAYFT
ncbi:hypothetical protein L917_10742 [Phytophthora nicotianae]|uniref:Uncharacterized protein n=1 Tax=Phytophthora nicotianae TaxID=4792 RepID=W2J236_PHYNI|nr:hypothetical protein L915_08454 [Phytophthora nicotianae]ETL40436.1 hypothetical protein L916_08382 [Phytophthora nicotianae]ETL90616.1 hypothetical protein L917_10742 [Phytophthora nicotianae]ETM46849.1 hypothetical protein L914_08331 [Phytophthora nicotianae]